MAARLAAKHKNKRPGLPTEPFVYVAMTAAFPGGGAAHLFRATGSVAPVSAAPPGEMAARLTAKHKNKRPGLPTEPFVYVAMTAAFPGGGAAHLFRATGSVAPVSAAPPGEMAARLAAKHKNKRPSLPTEPFVLFDAWQFPTLTWGDPTLPSALRRFTSEFGMGSGGTTALSPPGKFCFQHVLTTHRVICIRLKIISNRQNTFGVVRLSLTVH